MNPPKLLQVLQEGRALVSIESGGRVNIMDNLSVEELKIIIRELLKFSQVLLQNIVDPTTAVNEETIKH